MTGVKVPTIHLYRQRGLLPEPERAAANRFVYDRRHVEALGLIRLLRERRHLPLETIKEILPGLLGADDEQAFRRQMWEEVLGHYLPEAGIDDPGRRLVSTARLLFAQRGYAGVSIDDICAGAGMAKGSFYRYFASKDGVYLAAAASIPEAVEAATEGRRPPASPSAARDELVEALQPLVPLLLEVTVRALHGEPGHAEVARVVMTDLVAGTTGRLAASSAAPSRPPVAVARRSVDLAMARLLSPHLGAVDPRRTSSGRTA